MDYLLHHPGSDVNIAEFDKECGVGVIVTADQIKDVVSVTFTATSTVMHKLFFFALWYCIMCNCIVSFNHYQSYFAVLCFYTMSRNVTCTSIYIFCLNY